jgi:hypothetical protein
LFAICSHAQTKTEALTLTGGYVQSSANGGGHLFFVNDNKQNIDARTVDFCLVDYVQVPIWDSTVDCPPCGLYAKFLNQKFWVTYQMDSIMTSDGNSYSPIIDIRKMELLR